MPAANGSGGELHGDAGRGGDLDRVELDADELGQQHELRQLDADRRQPGAVEVAEAGLEDVAGEPRAGRRVGLRGRQRVGEVLGRGDVPQVVAERILARGVVDAGRVAIVEDGQHRERDRVGRQLVERDVLLVLERPVEDRAGAGHDRGHVGADQPVALEAAGVLGARVGGQDGPDDARARRRVDARPRQQDGQLVGLDQVHLGQVAPRILGSPQRIVTDEDLGDPVAQHLAAHQNAITLLSPSRARRCSSAR